MRRVLSVAGLLGLLGAAGIGVGAAHADQQQCATDLPFAARVCVQTTNSGGDGDEHHLIVSGYEQVPMFGLGFAIHVACDDNGGASEAEISVNVGPEAPVTLPIACPELP